jgi:hypothetical protein
MYDVGGRKSDKIVTTGKNHAIGIHYSRILLVLSSPIGGLRFGYLPKKTFELLEGVLNEYGKVTFAKSGMSDAKAVMDLN